MTSKQRYYDDPDIGMTPETSHPRFRALAKEDFYYDGVDDFSPFGNDSGHDTLSALQDWYRDGGRDLRIGRFLSGLLDDWGLGVPLEILHADAGRLQQWLAEDDDNETFVGPVCQACIATAFGQLKITGQLDAGIRTNALAALECEIKRNGLGRTTYPDWEYADQHLERMMAMRQALMGA